MNEFDKSADQVADDAKQVGQDAVNKAKGVASDAKEVANDAVDTGRAYAKDAINAAGKRIDSVKTQLSQRADYVTEAINADPMKAVVITAVVSSALTVLLMAALRSDDRYF